MMLSCSGGHDAEADGFHRYISKDAGKVFRVALAPGGDFIRESEEPMFRAGGKTTDKTYMGINVVRKPVDNPQKTEKYAYGVFTDIDNIYIDLIGGYLYDFETTIIRKNNDSFALYDNNSYQYLRQPFREGSASMDTPGSFEMGEVGSFKYTYSVSEENKKMSLIEIASGAAYAINADIDPDIALPYAYPRLDRFYGELKDVNPSGIDHVDVDLGYKCFGLKLEVLDMPEGSWITCEHVISGLSSKQESDYIQFPKKFKIQSTDTDKTWEDVFSMPDMKVEEQNITLKFTYYLSESDHKSTTQTFVIKPKKKKIIQISMSKWIDKFEGIKINLIEDSDTSLDPDEEAITLN
ncbi:MAG: hypothetical protein K2K93_10030 [Muribaculaceae bacterium]|nr:hypothetical protein [Muribaculaceae bacterium]